MRAVATFLVLVNFFIGCYGLSCKAGPLQFSVAQLDASQGMVVMTDKDSNVFFLSGSSWSKLGSVPLKHVSVGPAGIWGVSNDDKVYKFAGGDFFPVSGQELNQLDAGGEGHVVGVTDGNNIHCLNASYVSSIQPESILDSNTLPGRLIYTSCSSNVCWGVSSSHNIYFASVSSSTCVTSGWTEVEGKAVKVEVGTDGRVFVVNESGKLYERIGISNGAPGGADWKIIEIPTPIEHVSYDLGRLWLVTECEFILECTH
ncbi:fish-egg lectin-like [Cyprinodon tularosa]|uniref:fish-egg lectin-like n=1 Tax=Cyprinodon tularosa TaxID=77115 RepID=UPI0018E1E5E6|nr:fish-egg lectin-like [Cyprinodon tularosa]